MTYLKKSSFLLFIIFLMPLISSKNSEEIEGRIRIDGSGNFIIETSNFSDEFSYIATAFYTPSLGEIGWDTLSLTTNKNFRDELQAEAAGRLEASLTKDRIYSHYQNMLSTAGGLNDNAAKFFREQEYYLLSKKNEYNENPILYNAYLLYLQFKGLREQYNKEVPEEKYIREIEFNVMNSFGDVFDINTKYDTPEFYKMTVEEFSKYFFLNNHCTAIFKTTPNLNDVFFGHNSWYYYNMMTRIFKEYNLNFNSPSVKTHNVMFTSYPGSLVSNDDFYYTSKGLIIIETTIENYNTSSYKYITEDSLLCWQRVQIANRMSTTSKEWAENFVKYNSGTYNNQYMILDTKNIIFDNENNYNKLLKETLMIVEQMPGFFDINDVTEHLRFGYWPSYNAPYSKKVQDYANITKTIETHSEYIPLMDYDTCTRANILRRDQVNITDIETMKFFMEYNDYLNDPYSLGDPTNTVAARGDLWTDDPLCFGAFDAKLGSVKELKSNSTKIIHLHAGPTEQVEPLFSFNSTGCADVRHEGIPDEPKFGWNNFSNKFNFEEY